MTEAPGTTASVVVDENRRAAGGIEAQKVGIALGDALLDQLRLDAIFGENQPDEP